MLNEKNFINKLTAALQRPLPGFDCQIKMAPDSRKNLLPGSIPSNAKLSSVLILLYPIQNKLHTVFIKRQTYDGVHSGQISFPGGRIESTDEDYIHAALREANEEVNIEPPHVKILGTLTQLYIPPSNFLVYPVVGYSATLPDFSPQLSEVAGIIQADLKFLFNPGLQKSKIIQVRDKEIDAPYFDVNNHVVWGATAMILNELKAVIESCII